MMITWQQFTSLAANKGLSLKEQKKKFLQENFRQLKHLEAIQAMYGGAAGAAGSGGRVIDGPIEGAIVRSNVGSAVTDATGNFTLPGIPTGTLTVTGGTDTITGLPYEGELIGDAQYKTISPITTFAHYLKEASIEAGEGVLTFDEAITKTFTDSFDYFGISLPIEDKDIILQKDYIGDAVVNNNKIGISAQAVATQIEAITETIGIALEVSIENQEVTKAGKAIPEFSERNRKQTAYKALGRQANQATTLSTDRVLQQIKYVNPIKGAASSGVRFTNDKILAEQLEAAKRELIDVSKQEQYTNNYLTTQLQAVNRAQKTVIKNEVRTRVQTTGGDFTKISTAANSDAVKDALKPIEKDKANEKTPQLDGTPSTVPNVNTTIGVTWKQLRKIKGVKTLLTLTIEDKSIYSYFGSAKDAPLLLVKGETKTGYTVKQFPAVPVGFDAGDKSNIIEPNIPITVEHTLSTIAADTVKTYTLLPTLSSAKGAENNLVTLRLTSFTETVTQKTLAHIVAKGVLYTAVYTKDSDKDNPIAYECTLKDVDFKGEQEIPGIDLRPKELAVGAHRYQLARYVDPKDPLLALTSPSQPGLSLNIQNLLFEGNRLIIPIPFTKGEKVDQEKATMDIRWALEKS